MSPGRYISIRVGVLLALFISGNGLPSLAGQNGAVHLPTQTQNTFTVTNTNNTGPGSLSQAIAAANAAPGMDSIVFSVVSGPQSIIVTSGLPAITDPVIIDGTTQPGYAGAPLIELNGSGAGGDGLRIQAGGSMVKGLVINRFSGSGITLAGGGGNRIQGNYIGTDASGTADLGNAGIGLNLQGSSNNVIGGTGPGEGNVISGNNGIGINVFGGSSNQILGNYIGTDASGSAAIGNSNQGVGLTASSNNAVGGPVPGARNVISGNFSTGVSISAAPSLNEKATGNQIKGNYIGTNAAGTSALGNRGDGVFILTASDNFIGGAAPGEGNVISGNGGGVNITGKEAVRNQVQGNYIGTDAAGSAAVPNPVGVRIINASNNLVGGTSAGTRNVISGNGGAGVLIYDSVGSTGNAVQGNLIGLKADGSGALGNGGSGVTFDNVANGNMVGGVVAGAGNVIAFNGGDGVTLRADPGPMFPAGGNAVRENSTYSNARLGIDITPTDGVNPNDAGDADLGPNGRQNYPVVATAGTGGSITTIEGTLNSAANGTFTIDLFSSDTCDPSGYGEGRNFIGTLSVATDSGGNASFTFTPLSTVTAGQFVTATATDANGDTSEFSQCRQVATVDPPPANPPVLLTEEGTERAVALDSVTHMRDPFPVVTMLNFSADHRTRVSLFALNVDLLPGEDASAITVRAGDAQQRAFSAPVEYVGKVLGLDTITQVVVKLPDEALNAGEIFLALSYHGRASNRVIVGIRAP
jgi:titin